MIYFNNLLAKILREPMEEQDPIKDIIKVREKLEHPQNLTPFIHVNVHSQLTQRKFRASLTIAGRSPSDYVAKDVDFYYQTPSQYPKTPQVYSPQLDDLSKCLRLQLSNSSTHFCRFLLFFDLSKQSVLHDESKYW